MTTEDVERRRAAAKLLKLMRNAQCRTALKNAGHRSGEPVIIALQSDTLGEVFARVMSAETTSPAVLAVFWPGEPRLDLLSIHEDTDESETYQEALYTSTIGMLCDAMVANKLRSVSLKTSPALVSASMHAHHGLVDA